MTFCLKRWSNPSFLGLTRQPIPAMGDRVKRQSANDIGLGARCSRFCFIYLETIVLRITTVLLATMSCQN